MADYTGTWVVLGFYLSGLILLLTFVQVQKSRQPVKSDVEEHYMAGRSVSGVTLGLTAVASIFSGYTVTGLPAEAYRTGYGALRWYGYGPVIVLTYIALAPRLHHLAKTRGYVSVLDVVRDRFCKGPIFPQPGFDPLGSLLHWISTLTFAVPCMIYILVQFVSFTGNLRAMSVGDDGKADWPFWLPGLVLAVLLAAFETIGGLKAVIWTDCVQGGFLLVGCFTFLIVQWTSLGGMETATAKLSAINHALVMPPEGSAFEGWINAWWLVGVGRVMFPDILTRISAAQGQQQLRVSAGVLIVVDLVVYLLIALIGIHARALFNDTLPVTSSNAAFTKVCLHIVDLGWAGAVFGSLMIAASTAAIMSTADSVLMEVAKLAALDVVKPVLAAAGKELDEKLMLRVGRFITIVVALACWILTGLPLGEDNPTGGDPETLPLLGMADLSETLGLQSIFCVSLFPTFFWGIYNEYTPTWLALLSVVFGNAGGILVWVYKTNKDTLVGEPEVILPFVILLVNFVMVGTVSCGMGYFKIGQSWEEWADAIERRDADSDRKREEPFARPTWRRPSPSAPVKEPMHYLPVLIAFVVAIPLILPAGGSNVEMAWGLPAWALMYVLRIVFLMLGMMVVLFLCWGEGSSSQEVKGIEVGGSAAVPTLMAI